MRKQTLTKIISCLSIMLLTFSCNSSRDDEQTPKTPLETVTTKNIHAPQTGGQGNPVSGAFTKFSFAKNAVVTDNSWDIAFRGTTILVNGSAKIGIADEPERTGNAAVSTLTSTLDAVTKVPEAATFKQDGPNTYAIPTGSGNGWYQYNSTNHLISPIPGKIFVVRTHDGKYAKFEILSFYKDAPANPDPMTVPSNYYSIKFVYQPEGTQF